jgi:hypothetical protein
MKKIILLISVLIISGCVGMPDIFNLSSLTGTQKTKVKEQPLDVITVQNINTLPKPPINAGDQFSISFDVTNVEEERDVKTVGYELLDTGLCTYYSGDAEEKSFTTATLPFVPKQDEFVEWTFQAPNAEDLAYINSKCPVRFKVSYSFDAISEIEVDVISTDKYNQLQQSGEFQTFVPTLSLGRGPLRINMEFGASLPIKANTVLPVYVTIEDKGTGLYATIPYHALNLTVPTGFTWEGCGERFECSGNTCYNNDVNGIMMIERKSPTFRCSFRTPDTVTIEKIYNIVAALDYTYDITKQVDVDIKAPSGI